MQSLSEKRSETRKITHNPEVSGRVKTCPLPATAKQTPIPLNAIYRGRMLAMPPAHLSVRIVYSAQVHGGGTDSGALLITRRSVVRIHSPLLFSRRPEMVVFGLNMR